MTLEGRRVVKALIGERKNRTFDVRIVIDSLKFDVVCRLATTNRFKDFEKKEINPFQNMVGRFPFYMANNFFNIIIYYFSFFSLLS